MINFFRKSENKGTAAIEFAILLPLLLIMFFGAFEVSRYILVVRKVENTVNDINFILSREGTIHDINGDGSVSGNSEDVGRLERITQAMIPILMAPYNTDDYEIEFKVVARPVAATNAPDEARLMWSHKITNNNGGNPAEVSSGTDFTIVSSTSNVSGSSKPSSIYTDGTFGNRAELTFPGQTYMLINFAYSYDQIINNFMNYVNLNFSDSDIEKISSYAVRDRWIDDGDEEIQANEFYNEMQICTGCDLPSDELGGGEGRRACVDSPSDSIYPKTSGCKFNQSVSTNNLPSILNLLKMIYAQMPDI